MLLIKDVWTEEDRINFLSYLKSLSNKKRIEWSRSILNTKLDLLCLKTPTLNEIVKEILKGNYLSFLDLKIFDYYDSIAIYGKIIIKIKDFEIMSKYLNIYICVMENWAHVDLMQFGINDNNESKFLELSNKFILSDLVFVRRMSLYILYLITMKKNILELVIEKLLFLNNEDEYYVIMMAGWLLSECLIKYPNETLIYLDKYYQNINKLIVNKGIQKTRESRRVSSEFKSMILKYKRK